VHSPTLRGPDVDYCHRCMLYVGIAMLIRFPSHLIFTGWANDQLPHIGFVEVRTDFKFVRSATRRRSAPIGQSHTARPEGGYRPDMGDMILALAKGHLFRRPKTPAPPPLSLSRLATSLALYRFHASLVHRLQSRVSSPQTLFSCDHFRIDALPFFRVV